MGKETYKNNPLEKVFGQPQKVLNIFCTAGFPSLHSTLTVMRALQQGGADIIEIGMPYSDPIADGPVIQQSNKQALENGMTLSILFNQLNAIKEEISVPVILMGYINPVMQYGIEKFCMDASLAGVSGIIIPDLPFNEFKAYRKLFKKNKLHFIMLVTPETSEERIRKADELSSGFLYAVSSSSTTGHTSGLEQQEPYFKKLLGMDLKNPVLVGFGIKDNHTFQLAGKYAAGAIIGSAYISAISRSGDIMHDTDSFIKNMRG